MTPGGMARDVLGSPLQVRLRPYGVTACRGRWLPDNHPTRWSNCILRVLVSWRLRRAHPSKRADSLVRTRSAASELVLRTLLNELDDGVGQGERVAKSNEDS